VPGTVTSSLLTGMLGLQPSPTYGEVGAYLIYAVPMLLFVLWPRGDSGAKRARRFELQANRTRTERT
jgi:high-affinity iron transporter